MHSMRAAGTWGTNRVMQLRPTLPIKENDIHNALYYRKQAFDHLIENGLLPELNVRGGPAIDWDRGSESPSQMLAAMKASAVGKQGSPVGRAGHDAPVPGRIRRQARSMDPGRPRRVLHRPEPETPRIRLHARSTCR